MKTCTKCRKDQRLERFHVDRSTRDGLCRWCRDCVKASNAVWQSKNKERASASRRVNHLKEKYDLTVPEYEKMLESQGGACAICELPELVKYKGKEKRLATDHDEATGKVRALLCAHCNIGIGNFFHDPTLLDSAAMYLRSHGK